MIILFEDGRASGYAEEGFETTQESLTQKTSTVEDLNALVPDSFEGDWKENIDYFKLESGEIVFDESYQLDGGS